jgi:hypothetical protein
LSTKVRQSLILLFQKFFERPTIINCPEKTRKNYGGFEEMKSKVIYNASENATNEGNAVNQESGLSEKDIAKFKRKMDNLHKYLNEFVGKANHSDEAYQMVQEGLMDVMEWYITIR